eukprot:scaffold12195_cov126-Cylindrotheca_fusiformis.AAC.9
MLSKQKIGGGQGMTRIRIDKTGKGRIGRLGRIGRSGRFVHRNLDPTNDVSIICRRHHQFEEI